jgi:hypothetical protein
LSEEFAGVTPYQPWPVPGYAHAAPLTGDYANDCDVPECIPDAPGAYTVKKIDHHHGLVIVNKDLLPSTTTATLRLITTKDAELEVTLGDQENGVVVLFKSS